MFSAFAFAMLLPRAELVDQLLPRSRRLGGDARSLGLGPLLPKTVAPCRKGTGALGQQLGSQRGLALVTTPGKGKSLSCCKPAVHQGGASLRPWGKAEGGSQRTCGLPTEPK